MDSELTSKARSSTVAERETKGEALDRGTRMPTRTEGEAGTGLAGAGLAALEDVIFEEFEVQRIHREKSRYNREPDRIPIIAEISLKVFVNDEEIASMLCLNQHQEDLALGFLYSEGVIDSYDCVEDIHFNSAALAVHIRLASGLAVSRQESLRSITAGCGKCFTYINPQKHSQFKVIDSAITYPLGEVMDKMQDFCGTSPIYKAMGGAHSLLFSTHELSFFSEDIGRHNCFDKVIGMMLRQGKAHLAHDGIAYISGRVTSEIMTKAIRVGVPILVSKSTPSTAAIKLATKYNITLLGYVVKDTGYIYSAPERLT